MTIYIVNGKKEVVETINNVNPADAGAIGTHRIAELKDDRAYWTDRLPKGSQAPAERIERTIYRDENGFKVYQAATVSREVRVDGWLV